MSEPDLERLRRSRDRLEHATVWLLAGAAVCYLAAGVAGAIGATR